MAAKQGFHNTGEDFEAEQVFLVGAAMGSARQGEAERSLAELKRLVQTAGGAIVDRRLFKIRTPKAATLFQQGQVAEVAKTVSETGADTVAVDVELSPAQQRNLEKAWECRVVPRSEVILDIFAQHAKSSDGSLQVELAQLRYRLPRLIGRGLEMSRLAGGIGTRGPGEQRLEIDRRRIQRRILRLEKEIKQVRRRRETQRRRRERSGLPVVALVGYTNAGKSTLLNRISNANAYTADQLFATLDPMTRAIQLPDGVKAAFIDTVGFIHRLPHTLIAAFGATLEESLHADLLVQVADASSDQMQTEMTATESILDEIGATDKPRLLVWNKIDIAPGESQAERLRLSEGFVSVEISAKTGEGTAELLKKIEERLSEVCPPITVVLPYEKPRLLNRIHTESKVLCIDYEDKGIRVRLRPRPALRKSLEAYRV